MKKLALAAAGVVSLGLACIPMMGTHADTASVADTISLNLTDSCAIDRTYGNGEYEATVSPGGISHNFGRSTFEVTCNIPNTFEVTAEFTDLAIEGGDGTIAYSAANPDGINSSWVAAVGDAANTTEILANGDNLMASTTATGSASATVKYSVGAGTTQASGTYSGQATYTLIVTGN